ncbi:MAG: PAS domain-containing protein [Eubacteriales bacterium]
MNKNYSIYVIPILVLSCAIWGYGIFQEQLYRWQVEHSYETMELSANEHLKTFALTLEAPFSLLENLARDPSFGDVDMSQETIYKKLNDLTEYSCMSNVTFINMQGRELTVNGIWVDFELVNTEEILTKSNRYVKRIKSKGSLYDEQFLLSQPVYNEGEQVGVIVGVCDNEEFAPIFSDIHSDISDSSTFCILNTQGEVLVYDINNRYMNVTEEFFSIPVNIDQSIQQLIVERDEQLKLGEEVFFPYTKAGKDYYIYVVLVQMENFETNSWYLAEILDGNYIKESLRYLNIFSVCITIALAMLTIIIWIGVYKWQIMQMEYQLIVDGLQGGVRKFTLGNEYGVEHMSRGVERLIGYSHREVLRNIDTIYASVIHEEDREVFEETLEYLTVHMATKRIEYRILQRSGDWIWVSDTITSSHSMNGKVSAYGVVTNINELKMSDHYLNSLMESIPGGIIIFDVTNDYKTIEVTFFNHMMCEMLGFKQEEFVEMFAKDAREIIYKEDFPLVQVKFRHVVEGAETEECIYRSITKTGVKWIRATTKVISRNQNNIKVYAVLIDVDKQMQMELSLKKQRYYQELIDESLSAATLITAFDPQRTLLYISKNIYRLLGYNQEEFQKVYKKHYVDLIHPMELKRINNLKRLYTEREVESYEIEFRVKHKEGHYIWLAEKARLIEDDQGRMAHLLVAYDVTESKRNQEELLIREEEFRIASLQNNKIVYRYNLSENIIQVSKEVVDRIGLSQYQENIPESIMEAQIIHEDSIEAFVTFFDKIKAKQVMGVAECAFLTVDGAKKWYRLRFTIVSSVNDRPTHAIISAVDITDIKEMQKEYEELLEHEKMAEEREDNVTIQAFRYYVKDRKINLRGEEKKRLGVAEGDLLTIEQMKDLGIILEENTEVYERLFQQIHMGESNGSADYQICYTTGEWHREVVKFTTVFDRDGNSDYAILTIEEAE